MPFDAAANPVIRLLGPADGPALLRHLLALPAGCRRARFGGARTDADLAAFSASLDLNRVLGAAALAEGEAVAVALALDCGGGTVEVAVETLVAWRRRGLGAEVCRAVCRAAADRGATRAVFEFEPANIAMRALVYALGGAVDPARERGTVALERVNPFA